MEKILGIGDKVEVKAGKKKGETIESKVVGFTKDRKVVLETDDMEVTLKEIVTINGEGYNG